MKKWQCLFLVQVERSRRWQPRGSCSEGFLEALSCGETVLAAAAVRVVLALVQSNSIDPDILDSCGAQILASSLHAVMDRTFALRLQALQSHDTQPTT